MTVPDSGTTVAAGRFTVASGHPALPGHFPGAPVVPAVMLLDEAAALVLRVYPGHRLGGFPQVKFVRPVRPDEELAVFVGAAPPRLAFECRVDGELAVRGTLLLVPSAASGS